MRCAFGIGVAILLWHAPLLSRAPTRSGDSARYRLLLNLTPFNQGIVRSAIDLALARLARPGCPLVYQDFELPNGGTPQTELDRLGIRPEDLLENLLFADGSRLPTCEIGRAALTTTAGSRVIHICPNFAQLHVRDPRRSASLVIHESLHALGLGENPPSSNEITNRVERRCW
jgi:hypothetical protein